MTQRDVPPPLLLDLAFLRAPGAAKRVALLSSIIAVAGLLYALLAPRWYRATVSVMPVKAHRSGGLSAMLGSELGSLAAGLGASSGDGADVNRVSAVLTSVAVSDSVIDKFHLTERYGQRYREGARDQLWKHCDSRILLKPGLVQLSCEDKDPRFAQQMLEYFAEYGNQVFRRVNVSSASEEVRFLEKRVGELRGQADQSATRMRAFQEEYGIVDIESQTKAVVGVIANLNSARISKQLDLDLARTYSSGDEATLEQLESQISVVDRKLRALESAPQDNPVGPGRGKKASGLFPAALTVPKLRAEFETLYRDRKVTEAMLIYALERLESAKADEARDTSTFIELDPPVLPTRHSRPRRSLVAGGALLLGLALGLFVEWMRQGAPILIHKRRSLP